MSTYQVSCDCGAIKLQLLGEPIVHANCHCEDCRSLIKSPYHAVTAWQEDAILIDDQHQLLKQYQHPSLNMQRFFCSQCGDTLFNSNKMGWRVVSQLLIRKCHKNTLPEALSSNKHFFYNQRICDINDDLPRQG